MEGFNLYFLNDLAHPIIFDFNFWKIVYSYLVDCAILFCLDLIPTKLTLHSKMKSLWEQRSDCAGTRFENSNLELMLKINVCLLRNVPVKSGKTSQVWVNAINKVFKILMKSEDNDQGKDNKWRTRRMFERII